MNPTEGAISAASRGWYVLPCAAGGKEATLRAWGENSSRDRDTVLGWDGGNYAVDAGRSGLVIIDIDGPEGERALSGLEQENEPLPETLAHRTPRGGTHLIYRGGCRSRVSLLPKVDVRSAGGYALLPGSWTAAGVYSVLVDQPVADCPQWLLDVIGKRREKAERDRLPTQIPLDTIEAVGEAVHQALSEAPAVEGNGGDAHTYRVACRIRDLGVSEEMCLTILAENWNDRCEPPWEPEDLAVKVRNAYQYSITQSPGARHPETLAREAKEAFLDSVHKELGIIDLRAFAGPPPERQWLVQGLIPQKCSTLITGKPGSGKSELGVQLMLGHWTGEWIGHRRKPMPGLYIACEDDEEELHRRFRGIHGHPHFKDVPDIFSWPHSQYCRMWPRLGKPNYLGVASPGKGLAPGPLFDQLVRYYETLPVVGEPSLLILDTATDLMAADENSRGDASAFIKTIVGYFQVRYNVTTLVVAHPPKRGKEQAAGAVQNSDREYSGSTAWEGAVRARLFMRYADESKRDDPWRVLKSSKQNYAASGGETILCRCDGGYYEPREESELSNMYDEMVYNHISTCADNDAPASLTPQLASRYIGATGRIKDEHGHNVAKAVVLQAVDRLIRSHRVEDVHGKRKNNGLYPAGWGHGGDGED